ncbi:hypothetical protein [Pseudomonas putida]|uniref:hypothetical protein n=1 Tax=Pseudomonas putida TaxID=303 RepID=UPI0021F90AD8|nr:hypothetical protein [Pseudomonas putida]
MGLMACSVRDVLSFLSTIAGHSPKDPTLLPSVCLETPGIDDSFRGLRLGDDETWLSDGLDPVICDGGGTLHRLHRWRSAAIGRRTR